MNSLTFAVAAFAAVICVVAGKSASPSLSLDIYKNTLSHTRVIGGQEAEKEQFPHQASVQWGVLGVYAHICGGSLINENWVLTAAHCKAFGVGSYRVVLGLHDQTDLEDPNVQIIKASEFIIHPKYPGGAVVAPNDIALIKLETPAKLTAAVQIIPLPTAEQCDSLTDTHLSGWGLNTWLPLPPAILHWAQLPRISNQQCREDLIAILGEAGPLDDSMICTGSNVGINQSACSGDSGGPLVLFSDSAIVGVVSWGITPCGTKGAPSVYTRVCSHLDFISSTT